MHDCQHVTAWFARETLSDSNRSTEGQEPRKKAVDPKNIRKPALR